MKIIVGTPNFTGIMPSNYVLNMFTCFNKWWQDFGIENVSWRVVTRQFVEFARNNIVKEALQINADYIFWVDDDALINPEILNRFIEHDKDIIVAPYSMRRPPYQVGVLKALDGNYENTGTNYQNVSYSIIKNHQGLMEIDGGGTHCMLCKMSVFKRINYPWFHVPELRGTEDMYMCLKARKEGINIYCDTDIFAKHIADPAIIDEEWCERWEEREKESKESQSMPEGPLRGYISTDAKTVESFSQANILRRMKGVVPAVVKDFVAQVKLRNGKS